MNLNSMLARTLQRHLDSLSSGQAAIAAPKHLVTSVERIRTKFGSVGNSLVTQDRIRDAVVRLLRQGTGALRRSDRFALAYGLARPMPELGGRSILHDERLASKLLSTWESEARSSKLRGSHWRGLFHSYMQSETSKATSKLRHILRASLSAVAALSRRRPPWLETAERHKSLFEDSPCEPYVAEVVQGRREKLDDLISTLRPPAASWFWTSLIDEMMAHLRNADDDSFKNKIEGALRLADDVKHKRDDILVGVLNRYAETIDRMPHARLLAYSLEAWKSPQLSRNALWNLVHRDAKQMVCGWLAQEDLEDFYRLCQDEKRVDERRLKYWLRFKEQISYSQIVLGSQLFNSSDPDVREFRQRKRGRFAALVRGAPANNALLMQIQGRLFVEFSEKGNACYVYPSGAMPFRIGESTYAVSALKASRETRMVHRGDWERATFDPTLMGWGIHPDHPARVASRGRNDPSVSRSGGAGSARLSLSNSSLTQVRSLSPALREAILRAGGKIDDRRDKGGCLWVIPGRFSAKLTEELSHHGFKYKPGKGYYFE